MPDVPCETPSLTVDSLRSAIDMAAYPDELIDQKGRYWSRWSTQIPEHYRVCKKCGKSIREGYILYPHLQTAICDEHVRSRWL